MLVHVDAIVAESIYSFELNIALFDEIQTLSDAKQLHATTEEGKIYLGHPANMTTARFVPNMDWVVGFATGAATLAVGLSMYQRISRVL